MTTAIHKRTTINQIVVGVTDGTMLADGVRDSILVAMQTGVPTVLYHSEKQYKIDPDSIVRLVAMQSPLIIGQK